MNKIVYFYLPKNTLNDATIYYTNLLKKTFVRAGYYIIVKDSLFKAKKSCYIVAIRPGDAYQITKKNPNCKLLNWFQGVGPEEYIMLHGKTLKSFFVKKICEFWERKALANSDICLFVSDAMKQHYQKKYSILFKDSLIIPCYNKALREDLIQKNQNKFNKLSFVYAGGLFAWQCIDKTLEVFKYIEEIDHSAHMTILTKEINEALKLIEKFRIKNIDVKYVELNYLDEELAKYKYGFLLRENNLVNNVATPTKMNSYLSVGVIPIYTDVVDSFNKNINLNDFQMRLNDQLSSKEIALETLKHHTKKIVITDFIETLNKVFNNYYNDEVYIKNLISEI